jgi:hypothetical protein
MSVVQYDYYKFMRNILIFIVIIASVAIIVIILDYLIYPYLEVGTALYENFNLFMRIFRPVALIILLITVIICGIYIHKKKDNIGSRLI